MSFKVTQATMLTFALAGCGVAPAPDSDAVKGAITSTVVSQGGVCKGQTFAWINGDRSYGVAAITGHDAKTDISTLKVLSHRPTSQWTFVARGDSSYDANVQIRGLPVRPDSECRLKPAPKP